MATEVIGARVPGLGTGKSTAAAQTSLRAFPFLLLPALWASRNRARRRERGDFLRSASA
jgi:hypothetical protein